MLTNELNQLLTRTGPGTPMGEAFRRFWLPVALVSEVAEADGTPVRLRILHEDLVLFRDTAGRLGLVAAHCSHRLAPLFFGRNEECGLRCPYHGWKFDVAGKCLEMPNVSQGELPRLREKAALKAYPTHEGGGVVYAYMGPKAEQPPFPALEHAQVAPGHAYAARWIQRSNWLQGFEGEIDTSHISFLHRHFDDATNPIYGGGAQIATDGMPDISLRETDYGFQYGARRRLGDQYYWRITQWLAPMFSLIPRAPGPFNSGGGRAWVPIDDESVTTFHFYYRTDRPIGAEEMQMFETGVFFPPRLTRGTTRLSNGSVIDTWLPVANRDNDFLVDRDHQRRINFSGILGANEQDRSVQESMAAAPGAPGTVDRSRELVVASDLAIVRARARLIEMAKAAGAGQPIPEPQAVASRGVRALSVITGCADYDELMEVMGEELHTPGPAAS